MNLYVRPADVISAGPVSSGIYEQHAADLFERCAALGYRDFFLDIGANIGLTSYSAAPHFARLYAIEPNPLAFKLLEVNVACSEYSERFSLFNFGIGSQEETLPLVIPKKNWGGAFLESPENSYGENTLLKKDAFKESEAKNYVRMTVAICEGAPVFRSIFKDVSSTGGQAGVIKIDVEGFELTVIRQIARAIPKEISAYVLFENWEPSLDVGEFVRPFDGRAKLFRLDWKRASRARGNRFLRRARFVAGLPFGMSNLVYRLEAVDATERSVTGDIVMHLAGAAAGENQIRCASLLD